MTVAMAMMAFNEASSLAVKGRQDRHSRILDKAKCCVKIGLLFFLDGWILDVEVPIRPAMYEAYS